MIEYSLPPPRDAMPPAFVFVLDTCLDGAPPARASRPCMRSRPRSVRKERYLSIRLSLFVAPRCTFLRALLTRAHACARARVAHGSTGFAAKSRGLTAATFPYARPRVCIYRVRVRARADAELREAAMSVRQAASLLPEGALVGLITFGGSVQVRERLSADTFICEDGSALRGADSGSLSQVHELGFQGDVCKQFVFRGDLEEYPSEKVGSLPTTHYPLPTSHIHHIHRLV